MRLILITFIACIILLAYPDIASAAKNKPGKEAVPTRGRTPTTPTDTVKGKKKTDKKKGDKTTPEAPKSSPPASSGSSPSEEKTAEHFTRDKCPSKPTSCSSGITGLSTCCHEEYGVHLFSVQWNKKLNKVPGFTIHGLWPNTCANGPAPANGCGDTARRLKSPKVTEILRKNNLLTDMTNFWPSITNNHGQFWMGEWNKHGTCLTTLEPKCYPSYKGNMDVVEYFGRALEMNKKYDYLAALGDAKIVPSDTTKYTPKQITDAISSKYNIAVDLRCDGNVLSEIRAYFHVKDVTTYVPIPIPQNDSTPKTQCSGEIIFPLKNKAE